LEIESWLYIITFILLLILSAFFSGSESAYFSLSEFDLERLKDEKKKSGSTRRILTLLDKPRRLLMCILVGNTVVNVAAATVAAFFIGRTIRKGNMAGHTDVLLEIVVVTFIILVFSEVSPKVFAVKQSLKFARFVSFPLKIIMFLLVPFAIVFEKIASGFTNLLRVRKELPFVTEEELKTYIDIGEEKGTLDKTEREMIHSIFEFRETMVKEVMVPRIDMICIEKDFPIHDVLTLVREKGHSRIPVYHENVDDIIGILFVKDLLPFLSGKKPVPSLETLVRKPYFVPESKLIDELLKEFQKERIHMAIVVDEYGGTSGLVTLEDVIEEIVGEIRDEYDREKPLIQKVDAHSWIIDAKINIEELNARLGFDIPAEEDYESLGGFIFSLMGSIPTEKESVDYANLRILIEKVQGRRIKSVRIIQKNEEALEHRSEPS
jgi:putative hemolysin